jgi:hypothetical protein
MEEIGGRLRHFGSLSLLAADWQIGQSKMPANQATFHFFGRQVKDLAFG